VVWSNIEIAAAASISPTVPWVAGLLCVQIAYNFGTGTTGFGTPAGFTSLGGANPSATIPGLRIAYRFLDGTETGVTYTGDTTESAAITYLIAGAVRAFVPLGATASRATSTSVAPPNVTGTVGGSNRLFIAGGMWAGTQSILGFPRFPHYDPATLIAKQGTNLVYSCLAPNFRLNGATAAGSFVGSSSAGCGMHSIFVKGR
jgi:hypothetical protein